jgi:glycosyltransferase involved in cell wall biosynthesis
MSQSRDLTRVISAVAEAISSYPNTHLLMIGGSANLLPTEDYASQKLRQQVAELGLERHVHFTGRVPYVEVPSYYAAADIGISYMPPNTGHETQWPNKLIEIMMAGLIPVTNITIGAREVYQSEDAVIACGSEVADIAAAIRRAIQLLAPEAETQRKQLIARARARSKQLDWKAIIGDILLPIYAKIGIAVD